jgi:hypothetical protein
VREEVREVCTPADLELLQPTVYLMDSQDGQHEYPVRKEFHEVSTPPDVTVLRPLPGQQEAGGGHYPVADAEALEDAGYSQPIDDNKRTREILQG